VLSEYLAPGLGILINDKNLKAMTGQGIGSGNTGNPGAHNHHIIRLLHDRLISSESNLLHGFESASSGFNLHAVGCQGHAGQLVRDTVDGDPAFIADAHAAKNPPGLTGFFGNPQHTDSFGQQSGMNGFPFIGRTGNPVHLQGNFWAPVGTGNPQVCIRIIHRPVLFGL
jgi:hypothetical protein